MNHLLDLAQLIQDADIATLGADLFVQGMPDDAARGVLLKLNPSGDTVDPEQPDVYIGRLQVIVRDPDLLTAYQRAERIARILTFNKRPLPATYVYYVYPCHRPLTYHRDEGAEYEASVNYDMGYGDRLSEMTAGA